MNRSWVSKFAGLVLVLTLITTSLVAGTYAKYVTEFKGTGTVNVAKWNAVLGKDSVGLTDDFTFDLFETANTAVASEMVAPGSEGSFTLDYDTEGTEVAHNLTIIMNVPASIGGIDNFIFKKDGVALTPTSGAIELMNANIPVGNSTTGAIEVSWEWPFFTSAEDDVLDTADGENPVTGAAVTLSFTATQLDTI